MPIVDFVNAPLNMPIVVDRLYMDIMLMRDVESVKTSLSLSRVSQLRLCIRRLSLLACTLSYVVQLVSLLHHTVSHMFAPSRMLQLFCSRVYSQNCIPLLPPLGHI